MLAAPKERLASCPLSLVVKATFEDTTSKKQTLCTLFKDHLVTLLKKTEEEIIDMSQDDLESANVEENEVQISRDICTSKENVVTSVTHL